MTNKKSFKDLAIYLVLIIIGVALFVSSQSIETGATMSKGGDFMPKLCTGIWVVLSLLLFISEYKKKEELDSITSLKSLLLTAMLLFLYIGLLKIFGFVIMSMIYLFIQIFLFLPDNKKSKKQYVIIGAISIISPILVNWLFVNVFSLILPTGIF
ncbi:MAG: tripartite tricarboxylate transporter TctB family protein [Lachnospirales bacterium]